jgi:NAD(P)-dependent dehydrogenase (short-subunit alcohol dehydrogenase family)
LKVLVATTNSFFEFVVGFVHTTKAHGIESPGIPPPDAMRLKDKVAIVTGAGQGLGRAIAERFAHEGAKLVLNDINEETGRDTLKILKLSGASVGFVRGDVSISRVARQLAAIAVKRYKRIDILVNNAGIAGSAYGDGPVTESRESAWDMILRVNLKSVFLCCRYVIPEMIRGGGGTVINMASVLALVGSQKHFTSHAYTASKGAIVSLTRAMAVHYADRKIRVNAVCPGLIETPLSQKSKQSAEVMHYIRERQALTGGMGCPQDVAAAVLFLASDEARLMTGAIVPLDAGWSAGL